MAAVVQVADGDALNAGHAKRSLKVFASANAGANRSEADGVAGRHGARRGRKNVGLQHRLGDGGGGESAGAELNELATRQGILSHEIFGLARILGVSATASAGANHLRGRIIARSEERRV